jgi:hypothetical protein
MIITPTDFQNEAMAWIGVVTVVVGGLGVLISKLSAAIAVAQANIQDLRAGHNANADRIHANALAIPSPAQVVTVAAPAPVAAPPAASGIITTPGGMTSQNT